MKNIEKMPIEYLLGNAEELKNISDKNAMRPFDDRIIDFLSKVSSGLKKTGKHRLQDIAALSFWCRRAHLNELKREHIKEDEIRLGRGVTLHFAPGNIPTQFAYTAFAGLLAGNCSIVRLSRKKTEQETLIINILKKVMNEGFEEFKGRLIFIRYGHEETITEYLSALCDVRIMWGSDESVKGIRKAPLKAGAAELPFAARDSAAVFSAEKILSEEDISGLCRGFYNDTYLNDQNACSSPHIVFWMGSGDEINKAAERFWQAFKELLNEKQYKVQAETAVRKLSSAYAAAACLDGIIIENEDNSVLRVKAKACPSLWEYTEPGGFFFEVCCESFEEMLPVLGRTCQTVSTFGTDNVKLAEFIAEKGVKGVDRIVPVGHTLDFELIWDGFDMIEHMSRRVFIDTLAKTF